MTENTITTAKNRDLTLKQRKWIKAYIETGNATEAARKVYDVKDDASAGQIGYENMKKLEMPELMEEMGLTDIALLNIGAEGMTKANKSLMDGSVVPDYNVRRGYWETMLKLKGKVRDVNTAVQMNVGGDMTLEFTS